MKTILLIFLLSVCIYADAEIRDRMHGDYQAINKKLLLSFQKAIQNIPEEERKNLIKSQQIWTKYKEAECYAASYHFRDGTGENTMILSCLFNLTKDRIKVLKNHFIF